MPEINEPLEDNQMFLAHDSRCSSEISRTEQIRPRACKAENEDVAHGFGSLGLMEIKT